MKRQILQCGAWLATTILCTAQGASAQWNIVGPVGGPGFKVFAMRSMGTNLYAGGTGVAKWDGTSWTSMGTIVPTTPLGLGSLGINAMVDFGGSLYVGGDLDSIGGVYVDPTIGVAKWNGSSWEKVGTSAPNLSGVTSLVVYHGDLYAGGNYGVNKWNGTTWTSIGSTDGPANVVLAVYHDELYAASSFTHIGSATMTTGKGFAKWNGTSWTALTGFFDTLTSLPNINVAKAASMIVYKDELYVIGSINWAGTTYLGGVGRWNGTAWATANGGIRGNGELSPNCMSKDSNFLYVVGPIQRVNTTNDSVYLSAYWDGTSWHHMFGGNAPYTSFFATENYNGDIYSAYTSLVKWDGTINAVRPVAAVQSMGTVYPNPSNGVVHLAADHSTPVQINVTNMMGVSVYRGQAGGSVGSEINLGNMPPGMYILQMTDGTKSETQKLIIAK